MVVSYTTKRRLLNEPFSIYFNVSTAGGRKVKTITGFAFL